MRFDIKSIKRIKSIKSFKTHRGQNKGLFWQSKMYSLLRNCICTMKSVYFLTKKSKFFSRWKHWKISVKLWMCGRKKFIYCKKKKLILLFIYLLFKNFWDFFFELFFLFLYCGIKWWIKIKFYKHYSYSAYNHQIWNLYLNK